MNRSVLLIGLMLFFIPLALANGDIITLGSVNATKFCLVDGICVSNWNQENLGGITGSGTANRLTYWTNATNVDALGSGSSGQILRSNGSGLASWSTATYPHETTANEILYSSSANTIAGLATEENGVLVTSGAGVPSISTNLPTAITIGGAYIYRSGGTDVSVADGGTGASTAEDARSNLGLVIGTHVQAYNAALASIAGLTTSANQMIYTTGSNTYATTTITEFARSLIGDEDNTAARTTLGLGSIATQNANSVALTGGAINGIVIGGSSASSGNFTTLSSTSLNVGGGSFTSDSSGNVFAEGNLRIGKNLILDSGNISLATATVVEGDLKPNITNTFDVGTNALRWRNVYSNNFCIGADCISAWGEAGQNNYVTGASFSGTDTKTLNLTRLGLSDLTAQFTDRHAGTICDENEYLDGTGTCRNIPECTSSQKLQYTNATGVWSCVTDQQQNTQWSLTADGGFDHTISHGETLNISGSNGIMTVGNTGKNLVISNMDRGSSQNIFKNIANSAGTTQFSAANNNDTIRFAGSGATSISFNSETKTVTVSSTDTDTNAGTICDENEYLDGTGTCRNIPECTSSQKLQYTNATGVWSCVTDQQQNTQWSLTADGGFDHTISHGETLNISGSNGIMTVGNTGKNLVISNMDRGSSQNIFKNIANSAGTTQFSAANNDDTIRFAGSGATSISFNSATKTITISSTNTTYGVVTNGGLRLDGNNFGVMNCPSGQVIKSTGTNTWACADDNTGGTVNSGTANKVAYYPSSSDSVSSFIGSNNGALYYDASGNIQSNTLQVVSGGTGISSYTSGNYIYASGATTLAQRTPAQVLSDINAQQRVTGTCSAGSSIRVINADGTVTCQATGSGTVTGSGTATRLAFWDSPSSITSNANLYWDNSNSRLGIGTTTPSEKLEVASGNIKVDDGYGLTSAGEVNVSSGGTGDLIIHAGGSGNIIMIIG